MPYSWKIWRGIKFGSLAVVFAILKLKSTNIAYLHNIHTCISLTSVSYRINVSKTNRWRIWCHWGGKIIQNIEWNQQSLRGGTEIGAGNPRAPHPLYEIQLTEPLNFNPPIFLQWQFRAQLPNLIPANISIYSVLYKYVQTMTNSFVANIQHSSSVCIYKWRPLPKNGKLVW